MSPGGHEVRNVYDGKGQNICWTKRGAHLLLQVRCASRSGELLNRFQHRWRPMSRVSVLAFLTASTLAFGALAQDIPGQLPDVSTYKGSMEQQRRDSESAAQVQAQNLAMQQRLDANYAAYAPQPGGGGPPR